MVLGSFERACTLAVVFAKLLGVGVRSKARNDIESSVADTDLMFCHRADGQKSHGATGS